MFQSYHLIDDLTVYENLDMPLSYRDVKRKERDSLVCRHARPVPDRREEGSVSHRSSRAASSSSSPSRGRSSPSRTLILADEPTGNLHSGQGREIMELFTQLNAGRHHHLQVTHSEANAAYGSRIVRLRDGWLVDD